MGKWVNRLDNLFVGLSIADNDRKRMSPRLYAGERKRMSPRLYAGERVHDIHDAEKPQLDENLSGTHDTKTILNDYFMPKSNVQMKIYIFRSCYQKDGQPLGKYVNELRHLSKNCKFTNVDGEKLYRLIQHCTSNRRRRRALGQPDESLTDILALGRSIADKQADAVETTCIKTRDVNAKRYKPHRGEHVSQRGDNGVLIFYILLTSLSLGLLKQHQHTIHEWRAIPRHAPVHNISSWHPEDPPRL